MKPLRLHGLLFGRRLQLTGKTWRGWRCLNIWGGCWHTTTTIPGYAVELEESAQELGAGKPCVEGRECRT
jgi:hypothetical protein